MPDLIKTAETMMQMTRGVWERHANPWSVYTRFTCLPLIVLAIWSRDWIGWWALLAFVAACAWTWVNPRAFSPPAHLNNWASRGVLGERVWLYHKADIAAHHITMARILAIASVSGLPFLVWGLWVLELPYTLLGIALLILPKVWFVDRMVWVWDDWLRAGNDPAGLGPFRIRENPIESC